VPNSFLGFPVPRAWMADYAKKADCIADIYSAAGIYFQTFFPSLDGFYVSSTPANGVSISNTKLSLATAGGGTDFASIYKDPDTWTTLLSWAKKAKFKVDALFIGTTDSLPKMDILWGREDSYRHFGFCVRAGVLYGTVGNGSAEALTAALADWGSSGYYENRTLEAIFNVTDCEFWVDGVKLATLSAGLPTGTTHANWLFRAYVRANASANYHGLNLSFFKAWKEI